MGLRAVMGNVAAKEGYYVQVSPEIGHDALVARAAELGVELHEYAKDPETGERVATKEKDDIQLANEISGVVHFRALPGRRTVTVGHPNEDLMEFIGNITARGRGVWDNHSNAPPAWVESDNEAVAIILSAQYGCPIGRPEDWVDSFTDDEEPGS
jgi:hypothetical protein